MPKIQIRNEMLARRRQLSAVDCLAWSFRIQENFLSLPEFAAAGAVGLYSPIRNEVLTEQVFRAARERAKAVAYPRINGDRLEFVATADLDKLRPGAFGIREPNGGATLPLPSLALLVVPGVAFDRTGYRLGYGKGYYDRALHGPERPTLVGFAFEMQIVDELPAEIHDIRVDVVITEERVLRFDRLSPQVVQHCFHGGSGR